VTLPPGQRLVEGSRALAPTWPDPPRWSRPIPSSPFAGAVTGAFDVPLATLATLPRLLTPHPRARVSEEERHGSLPGWLVRPVYQALKAPFLYLCARGENVSR
jgi:hypothetical protein